MSRTYDESDEDAMAGAMIHSSSKPMADTLYFERLIRAGQRLARDLTEIDAIVRVVQSRPDWLAQAAEELAITERTLTYTLDKIKAARTKALPPPAEPYTLLVWQDWPAAQPSDEAKFHELIAAVETSNE